MTAKPEPYTAGDAERLIDMVRERPATLTDAELQRAGDFINLLIKQLLPLMDTCIDERERRNGWKELH